MSGIIFKPGDPSAATIAIIHGKTPVEGGYFFTTHVGPIDTDKPHYARVTTLEYDDQGFPKRGWELQLDNGKSKEITFCGQPGTLTHLERGQ